MHPGAVVASRGRIGVVWRVLADGLIVLPVNPGAPVTRADVAITALADRLSCVAFGPSYVRAGMPLAVAARGQEHVGDVTPDLLALIAAALARVGQDAADAAKWESDRRHRRRGLAEVSAI